MYVKTMNYRTKDFIYDETLNRLHCSYA